MKLHMHENYKILINFSHNGYLCFLHKLLSNSTWIQLRKEMKLMHSINNRDAKSWIGNDHSI